MNRGLVLGVALAIAILGSVILFVFAAMPELAVFVNRRAIVGAAVPAYLVRAIDCKVVKTGSQLPGDPESAMEYAD